MSRCFPFPPPGYEKKARTDDVDLLTKEKQKEKKHKKEKKDKKREGKEKKDKDRSRDKHKEKKDRKEKHKDKKDKDKDKDKKSSDDKNKHSGEKRIEGGILEGYNGGKTSENSQRPVEIKNSKSVEDLGKGIGNEERRTRNHMVETFSGTNQWRAEGMGRVVEKDFERRAEGDDNKPDGQRKREVEGCMGSKMVQNFERVDQKRVDKDNCNDKKGDDRKAGGQRNIGGEGIIAGAIVQSFTGFDQKRVEGVARLMDKDVEKGKEKNKSKASDDKQGDKHRKREKKSKGKDKDRDKEKEKEKEKKKEKVKEKGDLKNNKQDKLTDSSKDRIETLNIKTLQIPNDSNNFSSTEGNFRKRKDLESNGFLHENEIRPNKLLKPAFSPHPFTENGRKLEPCQNATQCAPDTQGASNNLKVVNKEHKVNGIIEAQTSTVNSTKSSFASLHASENGGASSKPPHPDTKYLSQILSIPKMDEWSDFDDQEWLFSSDNSQSKNPKDGSPGVEEQPQVWAEAVQIESADVCALPYVIPY